jgi:hypothetical protein
MSDVPNLDTLLNEIIKRNTGGGSCDAEILNFARTLVSDLADAKKELDDIKRRDSENCLEWQDWERWIKEVLTDFKIDFDPHKVGMRIAVTQWMVKALKRPTLEELRTWPCGCNWTYTYGRRIKCEPICPRCQKIEEMERSKCF